MITLLHRENCCGCAACEQVCPKRCITLKADSEGFWYPKVNAQICINCNLCEKVCPVLNQDEERTPLKVYAAINKDESVRSKSASGGMFTIVAEEVLNKGGIVFGVLFDEKWNAVFGYTETVEGLDALRKSKYVQAWVGNAYKKVKEFLEQGRLVLFTGTPCQIAGLKAYLRTDYENLFTIDLVCHGVPSNRMFQEYLRSEATKRGALIENLKFRDKDYGWGLNARLYYHVGEKTKSIVLPSYESSYYELFLKGEIYRPNCYSCPYANEHRPGDLTIGDFWGIEDEHPNYLQPVGKLNQSAGISISRRYEPTWFSSTGTYGGLFLYWLLQA